MIKLKIIWSIQAKEALKSIYNYYKDRSPQGAKNVKSDLLNSPKSIVFANQYQADDINPKYRRLIVRHYKVLYTEEKGVIEVIDIVSTIQSPEVLEKK